MKRAAQRRVVQPGVSKAPVQDTLTAAGPGNGPHAVRRPLVGPATIDLDAFRARYEDADLDATLERVAELAKMGACSGCEHAYTAHLGKVGPCTMDDCGCKGYKSDAAHAGVTLAVADAAIEAAATAAVLRLAGTEGIGFLVDGQPATVEQVGARMGFTMTFDAVALPPELAPGERLPESGGVGVEISEPAVGGEVEWTAILAPEGRLTSDGRAFAPGAIGWPRLEEGPLTLMAMIETSEGGHVGAEVAGKIIEIWRDEAAGLIRARGVFDTGEYGQEIARMVTDQVLRGVSVDLAIEDYQVGPRSDWFDDDGNWAPKDTATDDERPLAEILFDTEPEERAIAVVTKAEIGMTTVCPFPAFREARIVVGDSLVAGANPAIWTVVGQAGWTTVSGPAGAALAATGAPADGTPCLDCDEQGDALTASAAGLAPDAPPAEWFADPCLPEPTPLTVDDDGRIFGHAAVWGTCHIGIPGRCQPPPHSNVDYAYFHLGEVACADGVRVSAGTVTLDTGHAPPGPSRTAAARHYDDTGTAVAYVRVGEDEHGIWVAGSLRPDASAESVRTLRGGKLSGDWRNVDGNLELVALLTVNVPGFPVPHPRQLVASGEVVSLTAAGIPIFDADIGPEYRERFAALKEHARFAALAAEAA